MNFKGWFGYDLRYALLNQLWRLLSGPLLLVLVPLYLTMEVQGFWYTFISLAALAIFADMGFSAVLLIFSAHEFSHLTFTRDKTLVGSEEHLVRLATLWRFGLRWSISMALAVFPLVLVVGYFILDSKSSVVGWKLPWLLYAISSILVFINSMALSFLEGCDSVGDAQKIRLQISVVTAVTAIGLLVTGGGLYALALSLLIGALSGFLIINLKYRKALLQLQQKAKGKAHPWFQEIMPLLWRYAVSWVSGFFIFQAFTPIAFHYFGPVEAGQVGFSLAISTALFGLSNVWVTIITPRINIYVCRQDYPSLNNRFIKHVLLAMVTYICGVAMLLTPLIWFAELTPFTGRVVRWESLLIVNMGWFLQLIINAMAVYVRAHKKEPFVLASFINAIYVFSSTIALAIHFPVDYLFIGFFSGYLIIIPWFVFIFTRYWKR